MAKAMCIKCGKLCNFMYYKISPGRCLCHSCYNKLFNGPKPEGVTISWPPKDGSIIHG